MIPTRVCIQNFMNHIESDIDCSKFNSALITAKSTNDNDESNGLGKTTIFTAIAYALFGKVSTSVLEKSIRDGSDKCMVEFEFLLDDKKYKIRRARSANKSELRLWEFVNDWVPYSGRASETETKIADLIKINYNSFMHSVNFSQYSLHGLVSAKNSAEREKILKEPLNTDIYTKLEKISKANRTELKKEADRITGSIQVLENPEEILKNAKAEIEHCKLSIVEKDNKITQINNYIEEKENEYNLLKESLSDSDGTVHTEIDNISNKVNNLSSNIEKYKRKISELESKKNSLLLDIESKKTKISQLSNELGELTASDTEDRDALVLKLDKTKRDEIAGHKLLAKFEAEYDQANKSIPKDDVCNTCNQSITKEYRFEFEEKISKILEEKSTQISKTKEKLNKCIEFNKKLSQRIKEIDQLKLKISNLNKEITYSRENLEKDSSYASKYIVDLSNYNTELSRFISEHNTLTSQLKVLKDSVTNVEKSDINTKLLKIRDEIKVYKDSLKAARDELIACKSRESAALEAAKTATDNIYKLSSLNARHLEIKDDLRVYDIVVNSFSSSGIPRFIIYSILNDLQYETNQILLKIRPYIQIEFDEDINLKFKVHDSYREYDSISIGQKIYIAFALKLGYSRVIQNRLGVKIQFLLLDEVDQSLDKSGVDAYADVIRSLNDEFKCFVITHNETLKDKFTHAILVKGDVRTGVRASVVNKW